VASNFTRLMDLNETVYGDSNTDSVSDSMLFRLVVCTIFKWRTFKILRCVQVLNGFGLHCL
jgi:hypothetical protein